MAAMICSDLPPGAKLQGMLLGDSPQSQHLQDLPASLGGHHLPGPQSTTEQREDEDLAIPTQWKAPFTGHLCSRMPVGLANFGQVSVAA